MGEGRKEGREGKEEQRKGEGRRENKKNFCDLKLLYLSQKLMGKTSLPKVI